MGSRNLGDSDSIFLVWLPRKSKKEKIQIVNLVLIFMLFGFK